MYDLKYMEMIFYMFSLKYAIKEKYTKLYKISFIPTTQIFPEDLVPTN